MIYGKGKLTVFVRSPDLFIWIHLSKLILFTVVTSVVTFASRVSAISTLPRFCLGFLLWFAGALPFLKSSPPSKPRLAKDDGHLRDLCLR